MLDQLLYVQWAQRMASAVDTLRVVARSLPVLAVNRLSKVQPERTGCGGITDNVPPGRRPLYPTELRGLIQEIVNFEGLQDSIDSIWISVAWVELCIDAVESKGYLRQNIGTERSRW